MTGSYWAMKNLFCGLMTALWNTGGQMTQDLRHAISRKHCDLEGGWPTANTMRTQQLEKAERHTYVYTFYYLKLAVSRTR